MPTIRELNKTFLMDMEINKLRNKKLKQWKYLNHILNCKATSCATYSMAYKHLLKLGKMTLNNIVLIPQDYHIGTYTDLLLTIICSKSEYCDICLKLLDHLFCRKKLCNCNNFKEICYYQLHLRNVLETSSAPDVRVNKYNKECSKLTKEKIQSMAKYHQAAVEVMENQKEAVQNEGDPVNKSSNEQNVIDLYQPQRYPSNVSNENISYINGSHININSSESLEHFDSDSDSGSESEVELNSNRYPNIDHIQYILGLDSTIDDDSSDESLPVFDQAGSSGAYDQNCIVIEDSSEATIPSFICEIDQDLEEDDSSITDSYNRNNFKKQHHYSAYNNETHIKSCSDVYEDETTQSSFSNETSNKHNGNSHFSDSTDCQLNDKTDDMEIVDETDSNDSDLYRILKEQLNDKRKLNSPYLIQSSSEIDISSPDDTSGIGSYSTDQSQNTPLQSSTFISNAKLRNLKKCPKHNTLDHVHKGKNGIPKFESSTKEPLKEHSRQSKRKKRTLLKPRSINKKQKTQTSEKPECSKRIASTKRDANRNLRSKNDLSATSTKRSHKQKSYCNSHTINLRSKTVLSEQNHHNEKNPVDKPSTMKKNKMKLYDCESWIETAVYQELCHSK